MTIRLMYFCVISSTFATGIHAMKVKHTLIKRHLKNSRNKHILITKLVSTILYFSKVVNLKIKMSDISYHMTNKSHK